MAAATKRNPTVLLTFLCVIMKGFGDQGFLTREAASEEFHHQPHRDEMKSRFFHSKQHLAADVTAPTHVMIRSAVKYDRTF